MLWDFIKARLVEKTTWAGIFTLLGTALGWAFSPENVAEIATGLATLAGVILAVINSSKPAA